MVFNATFNNISVISWQSVLLMEETEYPEKTTRDFDSCSGRTKSTLISAALPQEHNKDPLNIST